MVNVPSKKALFAACTPEVIVVSVDVSGRSGKVPV
jgi:hypothetical protein